MKRDGFSEHQNLVKIREGTWRYRKRHGTVAATLPITCHEQFCELAILEVPGFDTPRYAARALGTEVWVHYYQLQAWMHQVVQELVATTEKFNLVADFVKAANRAITGESST